MADLQDRPDRPPGNVHTDQRDWRPVPDPTALTTEQLLREIAGLRTYIDGQFAVRDERFRGMDRANALLNETVTRVPTEVQKEVGHLRELTEAAIRDLTSRFELQVLNTERALAAALAAQNELTKAQDDANQKAIDKAEKATSEAIDKNAAVSNIGRDAMQAQISEVKDRITTIEQSRIGGSAQRLESRQTNAALYATVGFVISLVLSGIAIIGIIAGTN